MDRVIKEKRRFVYYTDADTALKMIEGKTLWLRQASLMSDSAEVHWGIQCIKHAYDSSEGNRLIPHLLLHCIYCCSLRELVTKRGTTITPAIRS